MVLGEIEVRIPREDLEKWLEEVRPRRVLIQAPLGLRQAVPMIIKIMHEWGVEAYVSMGPCWGGCDVALSEAREIKADGIIHVGHSSFLSSHPLPVLFIEARYADPRPLISIAHRLVEELKGYRVVGIGATVQWLDHLSKVAETLEKAGLRVIIGEKGGRVKHEGQVLGCDYSSLKMIENSVDCFVVIGSVFHALGLGLISPKPVIAADPESQKTYWMEETVRKILAQRYANITRFKEARKIGVIVSTKPGQMLLGLAERLRDELRRHGYEADILVTDEVSEHILVDAGYDAYVNTACPRLSIEDQARFTKPLLLPSEALVAVGKLQWEKIIRNDAYLLLSFPETQP